jgi:HK97 family phage portal protein
VVPPRSWAPAFGSQVTATQAQSEQVVAYGASVNLLASIVSMLPMHVLRDGVPGKFDLTAADWLDDPQGLGYGRQDFLYQVVTSAAYSGNAVCTKTGFNSLDLPTGLNPRDLGEVVVTKDKATGRITWSIGDEKNIPAKNVWHFRRFPRAGQVMSSSPILQYAMTLGLAYNAERFGASWFTEGGVPVGILTTEGTIDQETATAIKKRWMERLNSREPAVLYSGMKYQPLQVSPEESQFLATQAFTAAQCARILGPGLAEILGLATGDTMTYKNREQVAIDLLTYTVDPWLSLLERAFSQMLPKPRQVQFDRDALLRTDLVQRFNAYRIGLGPTAPFITQAEIRGRENLAHLPGTDELPAPATAGTPPTSPVSLKA